MDYRMSGQREKLKEVSCVWRVRKYSWISCFFRFSVRDSENRTLNLKASAEFAKDHIDVCKLYSRFPLTC